MNISQYQMLVQLLILYAAVVLNSNALSVSASLDHRDRSSFAHRVGSCAFKDDPTPSRNDQTTRAAALVRSAVAFSQAIRDDRLPLDEIRGVPQDMLQYWWLFGVARVPGDDGGRIRMDPDARHIVVMCRGQMYRLDVMEEGSNWIIEEHDLSLALKSIVVAARWVPAQDASRTAVGLLTTENQKVWSHCRKALAHEGLRNGPNLGIVDSSLFVLCLDDTSPQSAPEVCRNMICGSSETENGIQVGSCLNRWYDKLAIMVCKNGAAGMNFEHTCTDGSVDIRMACDIYKGSISEEPKPLTNGTDPSTSHTRATTNSDGPLPTKLQKLEWDIPSSISTAIRLAESRLVDRINQHQLSTLDFKTYGKTFITSKGFSPDAFFQMILQAAYYAAYGQIKSGFEPVLMRHYLHGRTDVARTTTQEAVTFAKLFNSESATAEQKIQALRAATEKHVALSKTCTKGESHHRHLYVLQQIWKRRRAVIEAQQLPSLPYIEANTIFTDPGWQALNTTILMGSNVENSELAYAGFGPAAMEGFTVVYFIRREEICMCVTSRNGEAFAFTECVERTLKEVGGLLKGL